MELTESTRSRRATQTAAAHIGAGHTGAGHTGVTRRVLRTVLAVSAVLASVLAGAVFAHPDAAAATGCPTVHYFGVGGSQDPNALNIARFYPDDVADTTSITYSAEISGASVAAGKRALTNAVNALLATCPQTTPVLRGYSLGALIAGDVCDQITATRCQLIADPRRPTVNGSGGILGAGNPGLIGSVAPTIGELSDRSPSSRRTEICLRGDGVCNAPRLDNVLGIVAAGVGIFFNHVGYTPAMAVYDDGGDHLI